MGKGSLASREDIMNNKLEDQVVWVVLTPYQVLLHSKKETASRAVANLTRNNRVKKDLKNFVESEDYDHYFGPEFNIFPRKIQK